MRWRGFADADGPRWGAGVGSTKEIYCPELTEIPCGLQKADDGAFTLSGSIQHFSETSLHQWKSCQRKLLGVVDTFDAK